MEDKILKKLPYSLEAEKALLGGIFYNNVSFDNIKDIVQANDFYGKNYKIIFQIMETLYKESKGIDPILVINEIKKSDIDNKEAIEDTLNDIMTEVVTFNLLEYAELIKEKAMLRNLSNVGSQIIEMAYKEEKSAESLIDEAETMVLQLSNRIIKSEIVGMKSLSEKELLRLEELHEKKDGVLGIPTGFVDLDRMTNGLNNSDLIILAARPAMGKTAFALNLALNSAKEAKKNVLIFSLEMPALQLYQRLLSMESGINQKKLKVAGALTEDDWDKLASAMTNLSYMSIFVADLPNTNVLEIRSYARKMKSKGQLDMIVIDYLQLINGTRNAKSDFNRQQEVSEISRALKGLARELDIPIIALSQLSRSVEQRLDKRPMLSDLRESGAIEQDADIVAFLYREDYYIPETENKGISELIIGKHRNGAVGTIKLNFLNEITKFTSYTDKVK